MTDKHGMKLVLPLLLLPACLPAVPKNVDQLAHFLWSSFEDTPDVVGAALQVWDGLSNAESGSISDVSSDQIEVLGLGWAPDLAERRGFYFFDGVGCDIDEMEAIYASADQAQIYPNTYDDFTRIFTSDKAAYAKRLNPRLTWTSRITDTILGAQYDTELLTELRRIESKSVGTVLIARTYQPTPATFLSPGAISIDQDFHIDAYYHRPGGGLMHLQIMWGSMRFGPFSSNDDFVINTLLENIRGWDKIATTLCQTQKGPPKMTAD